ncbi:DUF418 domain-containing protein [Lederbergia lenta]|uniref:Membrane-spanning protein n=1 Tax=Lederbergia lenta TaxID=1467 RepID=A0A2X4W5Y7_LEDLE|nr:DUF418 domain-containing protein [Lederbergia lenta]MEC2326616.1 DUF418 domain-containing protein [Lederbergia lenta]SQI53020.1 membrane-spanning protein [Lederbergia lenta]
MEKGITNSRIDALDYIRGFALLGIILVNILALLHTKIPEPNTIDASYQRFLYLFVEGRFYTIFSFLFGVGFYIFITRANAKGKNGFILLLRRLIVLLAFGIIHSMFQPGEALMIYAIYGLITLPFYRVNNHINLTLSIIFIVIFGVMGLKAALTLPLILLGIACGQYRVFENLSQKTKQIAIFTALMSLLSGIGLYIQYHNIPDLPFQNMIIVDEGGLIDQASIFLKLGITVGPIISAFYIGLLLLLLQTRLVQILLAPLKYYGRMALTNYLGQTAFILLAGNLFHFTANLSYIQTLYLCIVIYVIQIICSLVWLQLFKMGPFEWVWRILTYWKVIPLKNKVNNV